MKYLKQLYSMEKGDFLLHCLTDESFVYVGPFDDSKSIVTDRYGTVYLHCNGHLLRDWDRIVIKKFLTKSKKACIVSLFWIRRINNLLKAERLRK